MSYEEEENQILVTSKCGGVLLIVRRPNQIEPSWVQGP